MTDTRCQKRQLVKCPPFFKIHWSFIWLWLWKAATLSLRDLRVGPLPGNDDRTWPPMGPSQADEHMSSWRTHGSVPTAGVLQRQLCVAKRTYFNSAIDLPVISNRTNLSRAEFDFCISEGLVRKQSCYKPGLQGWGRHFPVVAHSGCAKVFSAEARKLCAQWISSHAGIFLAQAGFIHNQVLMSRERLF